MKISRALNANFGLWMLLTLLLILGSTLTQSAELDVAFGKQRPPFVFKSEGLWQGIEIDIVREALAFSGHEISNTLHVSNKRLVIAVAKMGLDAAVKVLDIDDGSFYSDIYLIHKNYAISRKSKQLEIFSLKDLSKYKSVAWQNATQHLGKEFAHIVSPSELERKGGGYVEYSSQDTQNVVFWHDRSEIIIIDKHIFLWNKQLLARKYNTDVALTFHDILPDKGKFKVSFKVKSVRDDFNKGLAHLHSTGKYQAIYDKYIK